MAAEVLRKAPEAALEPLSKRALICAFLAETPGLSYTVLESADVPDLPNSSVNREQSSGCGECGLLATCWWQPRAFLSASVSWRAAAGACSCTGQDLSGADWQIAVDQAHVHASRGFVRWLEANVPERWTRHPAETFVEWSARKDAAHLAAEIALSARLDDPVAVMVCA